MLQTKPSGRPRNSVLSVSRQGTSSRAGGRGTELNARGIRWLSSAFWVSKSAQPRLCLQAMPNSIEFWFDFASTYSYVAALRIESLCDAAGLNLIWKPFLLGPLFTEQLGIQDSPFNAYPIRGAYMWRDLDRLCEKYSLPWRRPTAFPRNSVLAARVACIASEEPWGGQFIRAAFLANFAEDLEIADPAILADLLEMQGAHSKGILERAASPENKSRLRAQTTEASRLGMFGAPNFIVSNEMFFGQDRLEDAIEWESTH